MIHLLHLFAITPCTVCTHLYGVHTRMNISPSSSGTSNKPRGYRYTIKVINPGKKSTYDIHNLENHSDKFTSLDDLKPKCLVLKLMMWGTYLQAMVWKGIRILASLMKTSIRCMTNLRERIFSYGVMLLLKRTRLRALVTSPGSVPVHVRIAEKNLVLNVTCMRDTWNWGNCWQT